MTLYRQANFRGKDGNIAAVYNIFGSSAVQQATLKLDYYGYQNGRQWTGTNCSTSPCRSGSSIAAVTVRVQTYGNLYGGLLSLNSIGVPNLPDVRLMPELDVGYRGYMELDPLNTFAVTNVDIAGTLKFLNPLYRSSTWSSQGKVIVENTGVVDLGGQGPAVNGAGAGYSYFDVVEWTFLA